MLSKKAKGTEGEKKSGFTAKDWVAVTISVLALSVSAGSAYLNAILKVEHVSLTTRYSPFVKRIGDKLVTRNEENSVVFVNSGNRPVVIFGLDVLFIQHPDRLAFNCYGDSSEAAEGQFETNLLPFVVKENEIAIKSFKIGARHPYGRRREEGPDSNSFAIMEELKARTHVPVEVCFDVELSTPSMQRHSQRVSVHKYDVGEQYSFSGDDVAEHFSNQPSILVDRKLNIFWW
jgi:hypothetical protein